MPEGSDEELPPLGEPTPAPPPRSDAGRWYRGTWFAGLVGLVLGALLAFGVAAIVFDSDDDDVATRDDGRARPEATAPVATTVVTVPVECVDAMRSAQQSLTVLEQGFQRLRRFEVGDVERMLAELQELRGTLTERVRECLERA
ncbi:MAG: hypothetical protein M3O23_00380 [Actinomycetota bacterium]|nr:hypothetical protein [Actinomycetota bacterium]